MLPRALSGRRWKVLGISFGGPLATLAHAGSLGESLGGSGYHFRSILEGRVVMVVGSNLANDFRFAIYGNLKLLCPHAARSCIFVLCKYAHVHDPRTLDTFFTGPCVYSNICFPICRDYQNIAIYP